VIKIFIVSVLNVEQGFSLAKVSNLKGCPPYFNSIAEKSPCKSWGMRSSQNNRSGINSNKIKYNKMKKSEVRQLVLT